MKGKIDPKHRFSPRTSSGRSRKTTGNMPPAELFLSWDQKSKQAMPTAYYLRRLDYIFNAYNYLTSLFKLNETFKSILAEKKPGYQLYNHMVTSREHFKRFLKGNKIAFTHGGGFYRIKDIHEQLPVMKPMMDKPIETGPKIPKIPKKRPPKRKKPRSKKLTKLAKETAEFLKLSVPSMRRGRRKAREKMIKAQEREALLDKEIGL